MFTLQISYRELEDGSVPLILIDRISFMAMILTQMARDLVDYTEHLHTEENEEMNE